jgi:hypothetical protein
MLDGLGVFVSEGRLVHWEMEYLLMGLRFVHNSVLEIHVE